jgi:hypothetical protein
MSTYQTFVEKYPSGYSVRVKFGKENRFVKTSSEMAESKEKSVAFAKRLAEKNKGSYEGFRDMTVKKQQMNRVKDYSYIKRSDISVLKATIDGKVLDVDPKTILSGTYVAGKIKPTAAKLRVAKIDPSKIREKMLKMYKDWAEDEYNSEFEKYITTEDIQKFVECGLTEEMIIAFYCGIQAVMDIKADNEFAYYKVGGVFTFRTDEDGKYIKNWVERGLYNCENGVYELGFKYPDFNWSSLLKRGSGTEVISTPPYDYFGKERVDVLKLEKFVVNDKFTVIAVKSGGSSENGQFSRSSDGSMRDPNVPLELNNGYLALVSRNGKELFALAKKLLSQPKGYVKDFDWIVQSKTSGADELKSANYKFAKGGSTYGNGGSIRTMQKGDAVFYRDETWYVTEKDGQVGIMTFRQGAWGSDYPFIPLGRISQDQLTDMYGNKVFIPYSFAKGGGVHKANVGALLMAEKVRGLAPKSFDAADTKIANRLERKSFAQRMSETGNEEYDRDAYSASQFAKGGMTEHGLRVGDKIVFERIVDDLIEIKDANGKKHLVDLDTGRRIMSMANGGGIEDDYMSIARTNARESINWDEEVRNYAGDQYDSLTEEEKDSIIAEMKADYDFHHSFAKGGKLSETKYIPRDEIIKVELKNGKVIENNWNNPIYSGLRLIEGRGAKVEREEMEAQGQLTMFKRGGKMPKYAAYVSQRNIAKVYLYDEDEPTVVNGRDLVGGVWFDNEKTVKLIESARKQGLIK